MQAYSARYVFSPKDDWRPDEVHESWNLPALCCESPMLPMCLPITTEHHPQMAQKKAKWNKPVQLTLDGVPLSYWRYFAPCPWVTETGAAASSSKRQQQHIIRITEYKAL